MRTKARATGEEKNPLAVTVLESGGKVAGHLRSLALRQRVDFPLPIYALAIPMVPRFSDAR